MFCIVCYGITSVLLCIYAAINLCIDKCMNHITQNMYLPYVFNKIQGFLYSAFILVLVLQFCVC